MLLVCCSSILSVVFAVAVAVVAEVVNVAVVAIAAVTAVTYCCCCFSTPNPSSIVTRTCKDCKERHGRISTRTSNSICLLLFDVAFANLQ